MQNGRIIICHRINSKLTESWSHPITSMKKLKKGNLTHQWVPLRG